LVEARGAPGGPFLGVIFYIFISMPVEQELISPEEKRTRSACGVEDFEIADCTARATFLTPNQLAY